MADVVMRPLHPVFEQHPPRVFLRDVNVGFAWAVLERLRHEINEERFALYLSLSMEEASFMLAHQGTPYERNPSVTIVKNSISAELQAWPKTRKSMKQTG
jgi:hypothetical protein